MRRRNKNSQKISQITINLPKKHSSNNKPTPFTLPPFIPFYSIPKQNNEFTELEQKTIEFIEKLNIKELIIDKALHNDLSNVFCPAQKGFLKNYTFLEIEKSIRTRIKALTTLSKERGAILKTEIIKSYKEYLFDCILKFHESQIAFTK